MLTPNLCVVFYNPLHITLWTFHNNGEKSFIPFTGNKEQTLGERKLTGSESNSEGRGEAAGYVEA